MEPFKIKESNYKACATSMNNKLSLHHLVRPIISISVIIAYMFVIGRFNVKYIPYLASTTIFFYIFAVLAYFNSKKLCYIAIQQMEIQIFDDFIIMNIDLDNNSQLSKSQRILYNKEKNKSNLFNSKISFNRLETIQYKDGDLYLKENKQNLFSKRNTLWIPKEIEGFQKLATLIKEKRHETIYKKA